MARGDLALRCFGKLPCYLDYLQRGVEQPFTTIADWIREGRVRPPESDDTPPVRVQETARCRFLHVGAGGDIAVGVIGPSHDAPPHSRSFPFVVFAHLPARPYRGDLHLLPIALRGTWSVLDEAWDACASAPTRSVLDEALAGHPVPLPDPPGDARSAYEDGLGESAARLARGPDWHPGAVTELLAQARDTTGGGGAGLEIPLSGPLDEACFDATFWLDLLMRNGGWKRAEPTLFFRAERRLPDRLGHVFAGAPSPAFYPAVMDPAPRMAGEPVAGVPSFAELLRTR